MSVWGNFERIILTVSRWGSYLAGLILALMMFAITSDVVMRYVFNKPIEGSLEVTEEILMIGVVFCALAGASHIRVTFITERLAAGWRSKLRVVCLIPGILFLAVAAWQSLTQAIFSFDKDERSWGLLSFPLYPSRIIVLTGFTLLMLRFVISLVAAWQGKED